MLAARSHREASATVHCNGASARPFPAGHSLLQGMAEEASNTRQPATHASNAAPENASHTQANAHDEHRHPIPRAPFANAVPSQAFAEHVPSLCRTFAKPLPSQCHANPVPSLCQAKPFAKHLPSLCRTFVPPPSVWTTGPHRPQVVRH